MREKSPLFCATVGTVVREMEARLVCVKPARAKDRDLQDTYRVVFDVGEQVNPWEWRYEPMGEVTVGLPPATESASPHPRHEQEPPGDEG